MSLTVVAICLPRMTPLAQSPHQTRHRASGDIEALPLHLPPDLADAVDTEVLFEDAPNFTLQGGVAADACREPAGICALGEVRMVGRRGDRQYTADRLDPIRTPMIVDERDHGLNRRSSSA